MSIEILNYIRSYLALYYIEEQYFTTDYNSSEVMQVYEEKRFTL